MITQPDFLLQSFRVRLDTGCDRRCFFCNSWHERPVSINGNAIRSALATAKRLGAGSVAISGGEPLISPLLESALHAVAESGLPAHVTTNGTELAKKAGLLAKHGVKTIHLSVESLSERRKPGSLRSMSSELMRAIDAAGDAGLDVEVNYLVLRGMNWNSESLSEVIQFCITRGIGLTLLDLLYSWNSSLEPLYVPYGEIRKMLVEEFDLNEEPIKRAGAIQTRFFNKLIRVHLRDYRAVAPPSLCSICYADRKHLGITAPQLSSAGTISVCRHQRISIGESHDSVRECIETIAERVLRAGPITWIRT